MGALDKNGYILQYFYTGVKESPVEGSYSNTNQLRYEKHVREVLAEHTESCPIKDVHLGGLSPLGMPWKYYYSHNNIFLEKSKFFLDLHKVEMMAYTELVTKKEMEVEAEIFSCDALDIWLNKNKVGEIERPVYKPIQRIKVVLALKKGKNSLAFALQTLGVRDTRISLAVKIRNRTSEIEVNLPDKEWIDAIQLEANNLNTAELKENQLLFKKNLPDSCLIRYDREICDFQLKDQRFLIEDISGKNLISLQKYAFFQVEIQIHGQVLRRSFEQIRLRKPKYLKDTAEHIETYQKIAQVSSLIRGEHDGFAMLPILARYFLGMQTEKDLHALKNTLKQIERRMDCADFMAQALIRFVHLYEIDAVLQEEIKRTMLSFRYWMDEKGQDAMCFWSENHSLMFYASAYFFGEMYPDDIFLRAEKRGSQKKAEARDRIKEWLEDVLTYGFEEFQSGVYTIITFVAMLNIVDYAEEELSNMARKACDLLLYTMAHHCYQKVVIAPQGRIYRGVLYPHLQGMQALVHFIDPEAPYAFSEWLIYLATTTYHIPPDIKEIMEKNEDYEYETGNALVSICKQKDFMLTSVQSPKVDRKERFWERKEQEENKNTHLYTKSLNERFHGTTQFEPGVLGYQQHLWYAALAKDLVVFVNYPGGSCEDMPEIRPGYWHGNGMIPAIRQEKNVLGAIYNLGDEQPIDFTHIYFPVPLFDETREEEEWIFGKKDKGYIGIWCSETMENHNEVLFGCEKRSYGKRIAYVCVCGSQEKNISFDNFIQKCLEKEICFQKENNTLIIEEFTLQYIEHDDRTQYVE